MKNLLALGTIIPLLLTQTISGARINQEGRILGPIMVVTNAVLFNTTKADSIVSAMQVFPVTSAWNEDISRRPILTNSDAMIAQITSDLSSSRRTLRLFQEMNYVLAPDAQPLVPVAFVDYPDESDPSPYPIPSNLPIEGWPAQTTTNLLQWEQDTNNVGGDRHAIVVQPGNGFIWEMWQAKLLLDGNWQAANGAKFNLNTNVSRPLGWTSGDAAGLPMFPALVRYDECERGMVEHACRIVVKRSRYNTYIYPATHFAAPAANTSPDLPAMGQRLRLKASFVISNSWAKEEKALLLGLKKYGAMVADNGGFFSISITPDDRWPANAFSHISNIGITNFEVIQTTGPREGPRSAGGPTASAGTNLSAWINQPIQLHGFVNYIGAIPAIRWKLYSGAGGVTFGDLSQTNTTATFGASGTYTLILSADDGVHAVAYDATIITVATGLSLTIVRNGAQAILTWVGGTPPYVVERVDGLPAVAWQNTATSILQNAVAPISISTPEAYFRVRGN